MKQRFVPDPTATVTIERTFAAPIERVWRMWTTAAGLERWYWPEPLVGKVVHLDVRPGGGYEIAAEGLPHTSRGTYVEVVPHTRLVQLAHHDFFTDVEPYDRTDVIELSEVPGGTRMRFTCTHLHSDEWNARATTGWASSWDKLARALAAEAA